MEIQPSSDAEKAATYTVVFLILGGAMTAAGSLLLGLLSFAAAGSLAMRWNSNEQLRRIQENKGDKLSTQEDSVTNAFGSMVRAGFDPRIVRRNLALVSFVLSIIFTYWVHLNSVQYSVPSKNTGPPFYGVLLILDACLFWSLAFSTPTYFRRCIASCALGICIWIWIAMLLLPSPGFRSPPEVRHVSELIFCPMVGVFIALAIVSFVDDGDIDQQRPLRSAS